MNTQTPLKMNDVIFVDCFKSRTREMGSGRISEDTHDVKGHRFVIIQTSPFKSNGKPYNIRCYMLISATDENRYKEQFVDKVLLTPDDLEGISKDTFIDLSTIYYFDSETLETLYDVQPLTSSGRAKLKNQRIEAIAANNNEKNSFKFAHNIDNLVSEKTKQEILECRANGGKFVPRTFHGTPGVDRIGQKYNICAVLDRYNLGIETPQGRYFDESHLQELQDALKNATIGVDAHMTNFPSGNNRKEFYGYQDKPENSIGINAFYSALGVRPPRTQQNKMHQGTFAKEFDKAYSSIKDQNNLYQQDTLETPPSKENDKGDMGE